MLGVSEPVAAPIWGTSCATGVGGGLGTVKIEPSPWETLVRSATAVCSGPGRPASGVALAAAGEGGALVAVGAGGATVSVGGRGATVAVGAGGAGVSVISTGGPSLGVGGTMAGTAVAGAPLSQAANT